MKEMLEVKKDYMYLKETNSIKGAYLSYLGSTNRSLYDCYNSYSLEKEKAYNYCLSMYRLLDGYNFKIISYNTMMFTVGFEFGHPTTGERCFAYITRDYNRFIRLCNI